MDEALKKSGDWPNIAITPGTRRHAATGEHVEQPESTRIGRPRGACRPDNADCEHEPADVENRPQDGAECADSRDKLEEAMHNVIRDALLNLQTAIMQCVEQGMDVLRFDEGEFVDYEHDEYVGEYLSRAMRLLDRQAAITEQEVEHDLMLAGRMAVEVERKRIAELTAERDQLSRDLDAEHALVVQFEWDNERLRDTCNTLRASVAGLKMTVERFKARESGDARQSG